MNGTRAKPVYALVAAAVLGLLAAPAAADTFRPTHFDDPLPTKCKTNDCSLREAMRAAENHHGRDQVILQRGTYGLSIADDTAAGIESGDLNASDRLTIRGQGPQHTKIDANGIDRVFGLAGSVKVEGLTIAGGDSGANAGHTSIGGGVTAFGHKLTLKNVVVKHNQALLGGGIDSVGEKLVIKGSTIRANSAAVGGGVHLSGAFVLPETAIQSSTISGNVALEGAGILADGNFAEAPVLDVLNSTIAGNMATGDAGGVGAGNGATVTLDNTTITDNKADSDNTGGGNAGGIDQQSGAVLNLSDSVLARNEVGISGQGPECGGTITADNVAVQGQGGSVCTFNVFTFFNYDPNDLRLGLLADNGGPTKTVKLLAGNGAIALAAGCPPHDQRGVKRSRTRCDAGAFERKGP
jgi:hypothetical protein